MPNPVVHWEIHGKSGERLTKFYAGLFGWKIQSIPQMNYNMVPKGRGGIGGGIAESEKPMVTVYVEVKDLDKALAQAKKLGGKVVTPPTEIPDMVTFAQFKDPEGNLVGLIKAGT